MGCQARRRAAGSVAWLKGKGQGHELLVPNPVPSSLDKTAIMDGIRWNDLPTIDGKTLGGVAFALDFTAGEKPNTANHNDAVFNTHFGCLQQLHSMAPSVEPESKGVAPKDQVMFTNAEVKFIILKQAQAFWSSAVSSKTNKKAASGYLGRLLHMVTDSYPQGHVLRGTEDIVPPADPAVRGSTPAISGKHCGQVYYFQGYPAQAGSAKHGDNDHKPTSGRNLELWECAKYSALLITNSFHLCATQNKFCEFPTAIFEAIYNLKFPAIVAGGATDGFQGPTAGNDFAKTPVGNQLVWLPKSTKRRANAKAAMLCGSITARKTGLLVDGGSTNAFGSMFTNIPLKGSGWPAS